MRLLDKVAIVTGSSRGIGKAIAIHFAREGADVVVAARTEVAGGPMPGTIDETAAAVRALGRRALAVRCNLANEDEIHSLVERALAEFGRIDVLVNNAAVNPHVPAVATTTKQWDLAMRINVRAPFLCSQSVIPMMAAQGGGSILNISSRVVENLSSDLTGRGTVYRPSVAYSASKAALDRLTRGLAIEVADHNIAVNALKPAGPTRTEGMTAMFGESDLGALWVDPDVYMTRAATYLAAQDARGMTGRVVEDQVLCRELAL